MTRSILQTSLLGLALGAAAVSASARAQTIPADDGAVRQSQDEVLRRAQDEARVQFDLGVALFEKEQYEQAAVAFGRAYELRPSYKILYNIAQTENELGHYAAALDSFERYLAQGGDQVESDRRTEVRSEMERLGALVGAIVLEAGEAALTVFVDGRKVGVTPLPSPLPADLGEHEVRLTRGANEVYREVVKVAGGQRVVLKIEVAPESPDPTPVLSRTDLSPGPSPSGRGEQGRRIWTWVSFGLGGAAAIAGAVTGGIYVSEALDVKDRCDGNTCPASVEEDARGAKRLGNATTALIAVAGTGLVTGVVLYFVEPKARRGDETAAIVPAASPLPGGAALALEGRF